MGKDILKGLNEDQLEAVKTTEGYLRVIAGAGSGKTKLLVSRYAYLVDRLGIDSSSILCVTFTNKAAGEMRKRIRALIGEEYDTSLICTYHGFCVRLLKEDIEKVFYPVDFTIIDVEKQKDILAEIYAKYELKLDHASFEKMLKKIGSYKDVSNYVEKLSVTSPGQILDNISTLDDMIIEDYLQKERDIYGLDFDDLIYFTLYILQKFEDVRIKWQKKLNYILVDEFQDSDKLEMRLVDILSGYFKNLMIVGDPDQNIYEWRGSDVRILVDFDKYHEPTKTILLRRNYRSTPEILACANSVIDNNKYRIKKELYTKNPHGQGVIHYHEKNEYLEADRIVHTITTVKHKVRCSYSDFAVLYRAGFLSRIIEKKFTENGIPYEIFGGVKFYLRMEIQDILAYLRLIVYEDDEALKRVINKPRRRFGRAKMQRLSDLAILDKSYYQALKHNIDDPVFRNSDANSFLSLIESLRYRHKEMKLSEIVEEICDKSGYEQYIRELGDMERFENLTEFKRITNEYETGYGEHISLADFLQHMALQTREDKDEKRDMVKLMTIHASKGLEFPYVLVFGMSEGIFPSSKTLEIRKEMGLEEERRLCYVALTRARKGLFLTDSEGFLNQGSQKYPSRFLREMGENNYTMVGSISKELADETNKYIKENSFGNLDDKLMKEGDEVVHPVFGRGRILAVTNTNTGYLIDFYERGIERNIKADFFNREFESDEPSRPADVAVDDGMNSFEIMEDMSETYNYLFETKEDVLVSDEDIEKMLDETSLSEYVEQSENKETTDDSAVVNDISDDEPVDIEIIDTNKAPKTEKGTKRKTARPDTSDCPNLWNDPNVPKDGWICTDIIDLNEPSGICQMCGYSIIRYVHVMRHPNFRRLNCGCQCAGKLEGNTEGAVERENEFKKMMARKSNFLKRKWKISKNGNQYLKIKDHIIVVIYVSSAKSWKYSIDNVFEERLFENREELMEEVFKRIEQF